VRVSLRAAIIVASINVASRGLGVVREAVIAAHFGAGHDADAFFVAFRIPDIVFNSLLGYLVATAFIPIFSETLSESNRTRASAVASATANWLVLLLVPLAAAMAGGARQIIGLVAPGLSGTAASLAVQMTWLMAPIVICGGLTGLARSILISLGRVVAPTSISIVYNVAVIASTVLLSRALGIGAVAVGVLLAAILQLGLLLPFVARTGLRYQARLSAGSDILRVGQLATPAVAALAVGQVVPLVETYLASFLTEGSIASLGYAGRLFTVPDQLFGLVASTVLFPVIAAYAGASRVGELRATLLRSIRLTIVVTLPLSILLAVLSPPLLRVTLARGAFDEKAVAVVAPVLAAYSLGLLPFCLRTLTSYTFFALQKPGTLLKWAIVMMPVNVCMDVILVAQLGTVGIAVGSSATACLQAVALLAVLRGRVDGLRFGGITVPFLKALVASAFMVGALVLLSTRVPSGQQLGQLGQVIVLAASVFLAGAVYFIVSIWLRAEEAASVWRDLIRRIRPATGSI